MSCICGAEIKFKAGMGIVVEKMEENILTSFILFDRQPSSSSFLEVCPFCYRTVLIEMSALVGEIK